MILNLTTHTRTHLCVCVSALQRPTCCIIACKHSLKRAAFWPWRAFSYSLEPVKFQTVPGQVWRPVINPWPFSVCVCRGVCVCTCMCAWLSLVTS